ncbi:glutamyl-tRNA(Gln) amidotransferase, subunit A [Aspergillus ruber CBS 135680]|uniref:Amidase signature enzyme n=1 Tax=Aspergillus ruber (strain CBS 135680) TaxID=1388766 RepID=A0A017SSC4_ASPRC|nr:amidase signature enzyme [Aspergillus ruber CBS 135680]EYE99691.1 amidase signature enzyme [Aspergillus ruber CBS 135680]
MSNGNLVTLDDVNYYTGSPSVSKIVSVGFNSNYSNADVFPITIIRTDETMLTGDILRDVISNYSSSDDVFQPGFLNTIFLDYDGHSHGKIDSSIHEALQGMNNEVILASPAYTSEMPIRAAKLHRDIPKGPYFFSPSTGEIYQAFRLYSDHQLAFTEATISDGKDGYKPLPAVTEGAMTKSVAVPSRLYYTPTSEKPLLGLRLGVKDIFDLKGLRTSGGNRAFHDLYPPRNATAPALQRLKDAGAIIVGKMGTVQFANGDNPTADWVDFHCPFNPRGDGYQAPGGSSSGPGAGIAAYDWLDIAVGSDTGGSMRHPGGMQGVYANRPSTGAIALDNVLPLCHALDTAGVFARDAVTWSKVMHAWYLNFADYRQYPKRIFYPMSSFPDASTEAGSLLENLVVNLEEFLGTKREPVNVYSHWKKTHPSEGPADIAEFLNTTYAVLTSVDQYRSLALPFYADYAEKHDGRRPFINPGPLVRWAWGQQNGGNAAYEVAIKNKTIFEHWWGSEGFGKKDKHTCSEGIYIYPYTKGETQYRNVYYDAPTDPPMGFKDGRISIMGSVPDLVVRVGEIPYNSTVTLKTEYMPVTMSFVAARGCDLMLVNLIEKLEKAGVLKPVSTGPMMYPA